ncbi:hypothetical protein BH09BAC5_BH09BAC5_14040 [soil metagenome]
MRKIISSILLISVFSFGFSGIDTPDDQVKTAATAQLQKALQMIPVGQETSFGFSSRSEFSTASVDEVFHTISLTQEFYQDENVLDKNYILLQSEWRVPVTVQGENRVLLTIFHDGNALNVVDIGGVGLAKELQQISSGQIDTQKYILRIYPLAVDFAVFVPIGKTIADGNYYPMQSALMGITGIKNSVMSQKEVLEIVKEKLKSTSKN